MGINNIKEAKIVCYKRRNEIIRGRLGGLHKYHWSQRLEDDFYFDPHSDSQDPQRYILRINKPLPELNHNRAPISL